MVFNLFRASKSNPESKQGTDTGMGMLLVFFPEYQPSSAAKRTAVLSSPTHCSSTAMIKRANSGQLLSKAQSAISICLLLVFLTLLFTLSTFEPSVPSPAAARIPRRFLSQKLPPSGSSRWRFAMRDSGFSRHNDSRDPFALQRMGALFRRGTRAMNDLVVAHVGEDFSEDEFSIFLRILHRSGVTAKADVVFLFGSSPSLSKFGPVIEQENRYFSKLLELYKQNPSSTRSSEFGFDINPFVKSSKKEMAEPLWGTKARANYNESAGEEEDKLTRLSYGSVVGFEADELDPENSLAGFLDHVPMSLRRWACYPMLLGRLRRNFKHVMLVDVKNLVLVGDPLGRARNRSPESVYLFAKHGKRNSEVNPALLMGGARGIRRLTNAMVTEIVRAAVQRKKKSSLSESIVLGQLVGKGFILKNVDVTASSESIREASSLSGAHESKVIQLQRGNRDTANTMLRMQLCSTEVESSVYSGCLNYSGR